jgi:IMP dehydrogenase
MSKEFYRGLGVTETYPNITGVSPTSLTYEDVLLVPQMSEINSRKEVDISTQFGPYELKIPVMSAPMDTITGEKMVRELARLGAIGTFPRQKNVDVSARVCRQFSNENIPCVYAIGLGEATRDAWILKQSGAKMLLLDVAHGGMERVVETAKLIKKMTDLWVIAGNITTYNQAKAYQESDGIDIARVGVGGGGLCSTRVVTGTGFPQLSAIFETTSSGIYVIADGGIKKPGDVAKALAAGAGIVMLGSMLAGTEECPGEVINGKKVVRGQASESYMKDNGVSIGEHRAAEGITTEVEYRGKVENIIYEIAGGLRSAFSYVGARNLKEFQEKAQFVITSPSTREENRPHINS